jgi:hypothetical protein
MKAVGAQVDGGKGLGRLGGIGQVRSVVLRVLDGECYRDSR